MGFRLQNQAGTWLHPGQGALRSSLDLLQGFVRGRDQGFEGYKKGRSGLIYNNPPGSAGEGDNPYARGWSRSSASGGMSRGNLILSQLV